MTNIQVNSVLCGTTLIHTYNYVCVFCVGAIIGFTNLGDINSHLSAFERSVEQCQADSDQPANSMLVLMVQGLFTKLSFPYAQFPCTSVTGEQMYQPFWQAVCRLERCGFRVLGLTCDGLSANRRLFKMHRTSKTTGPTYKVLNPYAADNRYIYFFSDPPHLMKTVRNCWSSKKRLLWVCACILILYLYVH